MEKTVWDSYPAITCLSPGESIFLGSLSSFMDERGCSSGSVEKPRAEMPFLMDLESISSVQHEYVHVGYVASAVSDSATLRIVAC